MKFSFIKRNRGFSLIEVIIGLAILFVVISVLVVAMRGRETESRKSAKFFNAVFLAQKIVDDLDNRCRENIYAIEELQGHVASGTIVNGGMPLFKYLEDTNSNGRTNDDAPITEESGYIYQQFKDFKYSVIFDRNHGNGLAKAKVTIFWLNKNGKEQSYQISQVLPDLPKKVETDVGSLLDIEITEEMIKQFFFTEDEPLTVLLERYHFDEELANSLAKTMYISRAVAKSLADTNQQILQIQNSQMGATAEGIIKMAALREENAIKIVQCYSLLLLPLSKIQKISKGPKFDFGGFVFKTDKLMSVITDLARLSKVVDGRKNRNCVALQFNLELAEAMNLYLKILTNKSVSADMPYHRRVGVLVKVVDLGSALVQNNFEKMIFSVGTIRITLKNLVMNAFTTLQGILIGRDYNRASYVKHKIDAVKSGKFREFEDISERLTNMVAVSDLTSSLLKDIVKSIENIQTGEDKKKKKKI